MDWETHYRSGNTPWDKGEPAPGLVDFLAKRPIRGEVIVPGCGFGHDVRAIARQGGNVVGIDLAPSAIDVAQAIPPVRRETYDVANLLLLPPHFQNRFDWAFEHTCFCALDPSFRQNYVAAIAQALKPGGLLLAIFFLNPDVTGPGPPFGITPKELDRLFGDRFRELERWQPARAFAKRVGREQMRLLQNRGV